MTLALSSQDLQQLRTALHRLVSPGDYATTAEWGSDVCRSVRALMAADNVGLFMRWPGVTGVPHDGVLPSEAINEYMTRWHGRLVSDRRRRELGMNTFTRTEMWHGADLRGTAYWNEWCVRVRRMDSVAASCEARHGGEVVLYVSTQKWAAYAPGGREQLLLRLLQPALAAGIHGLGKAVEVQKELRLLDAVPEPLGLFDSTGRLLHANPAFAAILRDEMVGVAVKGASAAAAADTLRLREATRESGNNAPSRPERVVHTPRGR